MTSAELSLEEQILFLPTKCQWRLEGWFPDTSEENGVAGYSGFGEQNRAGFTAERSIQLFPRFLK